MACINMFNPDHQTPRISFSNDFVVDPPLPSVPRRDRLSDPDFEFGSVGPRPMIAADELFFKGRMLPLRGGGGAGGESCNAPRVTTLRDELRERDGDVRPPKGSAMRWKELLGLKKGGKKSDSVDASNNGNKERYSDGGGRAKDAEMSL